jgi:hypothetical protein
MSRQSSDQEGELIEQLKERDSGASLTLPTGAAREFLVPGRGDVPVVSPFPRVRAWPNVLDFEAPIRLFGGE